MTTVFMRGVRWTSSDQYVNIRRCDHYGLNCYCVFHVLWSKILNTIIHLLIFKSTTVISMFLEASRSNRHTLINLMGQLEQKPHFFKPDSRYKPQNIFIAKCFGTRRNEKYNLITKFQTIPHQDHQHGLLKAINYKSDICTY